MPLTDQQVADIQRLKTEGDVADYAAAKLQLAKNAAMAKASADYQAALKGIDSTYDPQIVAALATKTQSEDAQKAYMAQL